MLRIEVGYQGCYRPHVVNSMIAGCWTQRCNGPEFIIHCLTFYILAIWVRYTVRYKLDNSRKSCNCVYFNPQWKLINKSHREHINKRLWMVKKKVQFCEMPYSILNLWSSYDSFNTSGYCFVTVIDCPRRNMAQETELQISLFIRGDCNELQYMVMRQRD